jgi:hypothetical protein
MGTRTSLPAGNFAGKFSADRLAIGRFKSGFVQLPQWLEANSLRGTGRKSGKLRREFFVNGREFSKPRSESFTRSTNRRMRP